MARITLIGYLCDRCGHEWTPEDTTQEPKVCPKCSSPYWDTTKKDYETFKTMILGVLQDAGRPLTWMEIRKIANLPQKFPNNRWVHRMEEDIGLVREKTRQGMLWRLSEEINIR